MEVKNSKVKSFRDWIRVIASGFLMGCADIVPGVSGATIAFIMGIYEDFIDSITSFDAKAFYYLFTGRIKEFKKKVCWRFLAGLLTGVFLAFALLAKAIHYLLMHEVYRSFLYATFLGLIFAALIFCFRLIQLWKWRYLLGLIIGCATAYSLSCGNILPKPNETKFDVQIANDQLNLNENVGQIKNFDVQRSFLLGVPRSEVVAMLSKETITPSTVVYSHERQVPGVVSDFITDTSRTWFNPGLFLAGAIAICAMLLPGISGSYLLTAMGMYALAVGSLADFFSSIKTLTLDIDAFLVLANLGLGIVFGGLTFSRVASWMLHRHPNFSVATLTGFMVGALPSIWPFWTYSYKLLPLKLHKGPQIEPLLPVFPDIWTWNFLIACICCVVGFSLVLFLESFAEIKGSSFETADG